VHAVRCTSCVNNASLVSCALWSDVSDYGPIVGTLAHSRRLFLYQSRHVRGKRLGGPHMSKSWPVRSLRNVFSMSSNERLLLIVQDMVVR
jgi:hypothetical protein